MSGGVIVGSNMVADISEFLIWWLKMLLRILVVPLYVRI